MSTSIFTKIEDIHASFELLLIFCEFFLYKNTKKNISKYVLKLPNFNIHETIFLSYHTILKPIPNNISNNKTIKRKIKTKRE